MGKRSMAIDTECTECGEELSYDDNVCAEHEHWYCALCDIEYIVPYEIVRYFNHKEKVNEH
jgi:hypothetical protein